MTDRELKKLRRQDLLEILIRQRKEIEELQEKLAQAQALTGVTNTLEAAQKAADAYLAAMERIKACSCEDKEKPEA